MSKGGVWLVAAIAVVIAAVVAAVALTRVNVPKDAAFVYGERVVSKDELNQRIDALRALYGITAPKEASDRDGFRRSAAKSYAVTLILDSKARAMGVSVSDKKARDVLDRFIDTQFGNRDTFVEVLGNVGTSERAVLKELQRQAATIELRTKVIGKVRISEAFLRSSFQKRKDELATPERRQLKNIVVKSNDEAEQVADRLAAGESVDALAAELSIDESTRNKGGDLGYLPAAQLEDPVSKAAFSVTKGQVYGPAKGSHGWNVGVVVAVAPTRPAKYADVKDEFRKQLEQEQGVRKWSAWLAEAIREADIQYARAYRPSNPDAPPPLVPNSNQSSQGVMQ